MAPIQNVVYLVAMALIAGARSRRHIKATVESGFWKVMKVSWFTSPLALAFAQKFLPDHLWVPFFNLVAFTIGTYINTVTKKKRLAALKKKHFGDGASNRGSDGDVQLRDRDRDRGMRDREMRDREMRERELRDREMRADRERRPGPPPPTDRREAAASGNDHHPEYAPGHVGGPPTQY